MTFVDSRRSSIFIQDLRLQARVGVNPGEEGAAQPISVDLWVGIEDLTRPAQSEQLRDTMDYVAVARTVRKVVERRHYPLAETLAAEIGQAVLSRPGATWVRLRLRKLKCLRSAAGAGVELELSLDDALRHPRPIRPPQQDTAAEEIVVVGGGAAGLAACLWCWRLGHPALLVDPAPRLGGQLHLVHRVMPDLPAMNPIDGLSLARRLWRQFLAHSGRWLQAEVRQLAEGPAGWQLQLAAPDGPPAPITLTARAIILTTGVRRRQLGVPGERELAGRGLLETAARDIGPLAGQQVVVVGGGDAACENAMMLADIGAKVTLVHRGLQLSARRQLAEAVSRGHSLQLRLSSRVIRLIGKERLEQVEVESPSGRELLSAQAALVRIGWEPQSELAPAAWRRPDGYLAAEGGGGVVGAPGAFVAGDLLGRLSPSVATAFGSGATAATAAVKWLEAEPAAR